MQLVPPAILAFALASSMPPLASTGATRPTAFRLAPSSAEASEIIDSLQAAEQKANEDPATGIEPLRAVLDRYEDLGRALGRDTKAHEARIYALLALARAQQAVGQNAEAAQTMDEAIRVARGDTLPAKTFGPRLVALYESRRSAPENRPDGSIVVECNPACDVLLDARHAGSGSRVEVADVPLGPHRLQVHAIDEAIEGEVDEQIRLTADAPTFALAWPTEGETPPGPGKPDIIEPDPVEAGPRRILPRWAGVVGVATGAAAMIAGGVLLAFHGRCPDGSDPAGPEPCINVLETRAPGIALLAVGGAVFTGFGVALIVGETRGRGKRGTTGAMLGYTLRF